jgi:hypothetical protein
MDPGALSLAVLRGWRGTGPGVCQPNSNPGSVSCGDRGARLYTPSGEKLC